MQFVDEENVFPVGLGNLFHNRLQAFFEFTTKLCASNEGAEIERDELFVLEGFGNVTSHNAKSETFDDGGFTNSGLANKDWIVFGATGKHLHDAANFFITSNNWIEFTVTSPFGEVEAVLFDSLEFRFRALGIKLKQFYGQTETCALTAAQAEGRVKLHTVGRPMDGVELRVDDSGEILVRSPSVIDGYFDDPDGTAKAIVDGWLHTGDAGRIDEDGDLIVLGRVSEVVRTADGERFIPNFIENRLKFSPYVRNVAVIGAGRDQLTAIVCIDFDAVGHWAEERRISYASYADLSQNPQVQGLIASVVTHVNKLQPPGLRIRRFVNLHKDFDADDGEITRTRKLRRNTIETTYASLIAALYGSERETVFDAAITYESGERGVIRRTLTISEVPV